MLRVLHLTPHFGGGVGKALSGLTKASKLYGDQIEHSFVCFQKPEKSQFLDVIKQCNCDVIVRPNIETLHHEISNTNVVQLEWWNHPATFEYLEKLGTFRAILLVWCHQSGLVNPIIPTPLIKAASKFILTSSCSLENPELSSIDRYNKGLIEVVSSGAGFEDLPNELKEINGQDKKLNVGYLGTLGFSKLHPDFVKWVSTIHDPDFHVRLIGDIKNKAILQKQCKKVGKPNLLEFAGYTPDIILELKKMDVMAYLLNPRHFGTAENAMLEAMSMGVVPIVLDNPCERAIVQHMDTGLVVSSPEEFSKAYEFLRQNPSERARISKAASKDIRQRFSTQVLATEFHRLYNEVAQQNKKIISSEKLFGKTPDQWFLSCQNDPDFFHNLKEGDAISAYDIPHDIMERSKGSVFQFHSNFKKNEILAKWVKILDKVKS